MGKMFITVKLDDETEKQFRRKANERYDEKQGAFTWTVADLITAFVDGKIKLPLPEEK